MNANPKPRTTAQPDSNRRRRRVFTGTAALGSAATAALFSVNTHADAAIVYSGPLNIAVGGAGHVYSNVKIDMNGDAINDFAFIMQNTTKRGNALLGTVGNNRSVALVAANSAKRLASGNNISGAAGLNFQHAFFSGNAKHLLSNGSLGLHGTWALGQVGFAAVRLNVAAGQNDYGWIKLRVDSTDADPYPDQVTILGYAYNNVANQAIAAGDTGAVPEPGTSALLLLAGAGGALQLRRKRKQAGAARA